MPARIDAMATPPSRSRPATFSAEADVFLSDIPAFATQANALADEVATNTDTAIAKTGIAITKAAEAEASALEAANALAATIAAGGVTVWVTGTNYALNSRVLSPLSSLIYLRIVAGAGAADPSNDNVNWFCLDGNADATSLFLHANYGGF